jgi:hypothetical protein
LTASYGEKWLTPPKIDPNLEWANPDEPAAPPQQEQASSPPFPFEEPGKPSVFWDILAWIVGCAAVLGAIWLIRLLWREKTWTWQGIVQALLRWLRKEPKTAEQLPYIEEMRSLAKKKSNRKNRWGAFFHRQEKGPDWDSLSNRGKVRRLYEEAVVTGIEQGYPFQAGHTPAETVAAMARWTREHPPADKDKAHWDWFNRVRDVLLNFYERAKYSSHTLTEEEVNSLKKERR